MREWLSGRASPCQGECREFESRLPLHFQAGWLECGCSSMVELQPSKLATWVRFPSPAPRRDRFRDHNPTRFIRVGFLIAPSSLPVPQKSTASLSYKKRSLVPRSVFCTSLAYRFFAVARLRCEGHTAIIFGLTIHDGEFRSGYPILNRMGFLLF